VFSLESAASLDKSIGDLKVNIPAVVSCAHTDMTSDAFTKMQASGVALFSPEFCISSNVCDSKPGTHQTLPSFTGYSSLGVIDSSGKLVSYLGATHLKVR